MTQTLFAGFGPVRVGITSRASATASISVISRDRAIVRAKDVPCIGLELGLGLITGRAEQS